MVSQELADRIDRVCVAEGLSASAVARGVLEGYLDEWHAARQGRPGRLTLALTPEIAAVLDAASSLTGLAAPAVVQTIVAEYTPAYLAHARERADALRVAAEAARTPPSPDPA
jgi:hypothetical protein